MGLMLFASEKRASWRSTADRSWFWVVEVKLVGSWMLLHVEFVVLTSFLGVLSEDLVWLPYYF